MYRLYEFYHSGNAYKVRLLLTQLEIPFERVEIDILKGETRTLEFLAKNPNGRVPVLEIRPDLFLSESNAILFYLSEGTQYLPTQPIERAQVLQWLFFEQYSHEPNIATSRFWISILGKASEYHDPLKKKHELGYAALEVMEQHLIDHNFFVGEQYTIADIGLFAYTHVAYEGGFDLTKFPATRAWLERIKTQPKHITIMQ